MNLQRREEIRVIAECPNDMHWAQEMRRAVAELLAHIATLEQAAAERVIADGSRGPTPDYTGEGSAWVPPVEARAMVVPENLLHDLAVAAWDEGADAGMMWDPDADPAKRGVVPCTPGEGIAKARDHFAKHGSGSPSSAFSRALQAIREHSRAIPAKLKSLESMRSRLCAALGLPADSAPETVAEALNHTALVGRGELSILRDFAARRMGPRESDRLEMTQDGYAETLRAIRANQGGV